MHEDADESPPSPDLLAELEALLRRDTARGSVSQLLVEAGLKQGLQGDYRYWKDIMDRVAGKPNSPVSEEIEHGLQVIIQLAQRPDTIDATEHDSTHPDEPDTPDDQAQAVDD